MQSVYAPVYYPLFKAVSAPSACPTGPQPTSSRSSRTRAPRGRPARAQGGKLIKVYSNLQLFHTPGKRFFAETMCETQLFVGFETAPRRAARPTALDVRVFVLRAGL